MILECGSNAILGSEQKAANLEVNELDYEQVQSGTNSNRVIGGVTDPAASADSIHIPSAEHCQSEESHLTETIHVPSSAPQVASTSSSRDLVGYPNADCIDSNSLSEPWRNANGQRYFNGGANVDETPWLLDEDFCLEDLNWPISDNDPAQPSDFGALDADFEPLRDNMSIDIDQFGRSSYHTTDITVQSQWHARLAVDRDLLYSSSKSAGQDQVDETFRAGLSNRLATGIHDNSLPPTDFLVLHLCRRYMNYLIWVRIFA